MRAFTLIEMLAVIVLLALGVTLLTPLLATSGSTIRAVAVQVLELDARARLIAQGAGRVSLGFNETGGLDTVLIIEESIEQITSWSPPAGVVVSLRSVEGAQLKTLRYDASGRSEDVFFVLQSQDSRTVLAVAGLSGWARELGDEAPDP